MRHTLFLGTILFCACQGNQKPIEDNVAPVVTRIWLEPTDNITTSTQLYCVVNATDPNDDPLNLDYIWTNQNGDVVSDTWDVLLDPTIVQPEDELTCTGTIDDGEFTVEESLTVTVENTAPEILTIAILPENPNNDTLISCVVEAEDVDLESLSIDYSWTQGGVEIGTEAELQLSNELLASSDPVSCTAVVTDGYGGTATESVETTIFNRAPSIGSIAITPETPVSTDVLNCTVSDVIDEDGDDVILTYEWHLVDSNGTDTIVQTSDGSALDSTFFAKGDSVYVIVTPNDGLDNGLSKTSDTITITNSTPRDLLVSIISDDNFYNDSTLTCVAGAIDTDETDGVDTLSYDYTWSTGDTGTTLALDGSITPNTDVTCTVTVSDGTDSISSDALSTLTNRPPTLSVLLQQGLTAETTSLLCQTTVDDLDGTIPSLSYTWTVAGTLNSETSDTFSGPFVQGQTIECAVEASDGIDITVAAATTTVGNSAPNVDSVVLSPGTAYTDSTLSVTTTISDIDSNQSPTASYEWHIVDANGVDTIATGQTALSLSNSTLNEHFMKGDSVYVIVTANDGVDDGTPVQSNSINILNSIPTSPTIIAYGSPNDPPVEGSDNLMCDINAPSSDIDGDAISYTYEWTIDSSGSIEQTTTGTTDVSNTFPGTGTIADTWTCTVTANDGEVDSTPTSASIDVESDVVEIFVYGTIAGQDDWSGMTNSYGQPDAFPAGSMVSGDQSDRGDSIVGNNLPEEGEVYNRDQSWWFKRGYDSPGIGTPYSPNLSVNTTDSDGDGSPDQGFYYQIAFKAATEAGDNSIIAVITGDPAGVDRASNYLAIYNAVGNLNIQTYSGGSFNILIDNLDTTVWHILEATMYRDGDLDYWTYRVDGVEIISDEMGYFSDFRVANGFGYTESSRVKFQPRHTNQDASFQGFFFDDLVTQTLDSTTGIVIDGYSTGFE